MGRLPVGGGEAGGPVGRGLGVGGVGRPLMGGGAGAAEVEEPAAGAFPSVGEGALGGAGR